MIQVELADRGSIRSGIVKIVHGGVVVACTFKCSATYVQARNARRISTSD